MINRWCDVAVTEHSKLGICLVLVVKQGVTLYLDYAGIKTGVLYRYGFILLEKFYYYIIV